MLLVHWPSIHNTRGSICSPEMMRVAGIDREEICVDLGTYRLFVWLLFQGQPHEDSHVSLREADAFGVMC